MNAIGKDGRRVEKMKVTAEGSLREPGYRTTAAELLRRCREFYGDESNEEAFRAWKAEKGGKKEWERGRFGSGRPCSAR